MPKCSICGHKLPWFDLGGGRRIPDDCQRCRDKGKRIAATFEPAPICTWFRDSDSAMWKTDCGAAFQLSNDDTLEENHFHFCTFCGKRISEV